MFHMVLRSQIIPSGKFGCHVQKNNSHTIWSNPNRVLSYPNIFIEYISMFGKTNREKTSKILSETKFIWIRKHGMYWVYIFPIQLLKIIAKHKTNKTLSKSPWVLVLRRCSRITVTSITCINNSIKNCLVADKWITIQG